LTLLDENLTAAAGKEGDPEAAARARAMLVVLREDAGLMRGLMPAARERLEKNTPTAATTCFFLGVLAARGRQLDAAEQLFGQCLRYNQSGSPRLVQKESEVYQNLLLVLRRGRKDEAIVALCREGLEKAKATQAFYFHLHMAQALARMGKLADGLREADA